MRIMTTDEHGDSQAFGQPAKIVHAKSGDGVFEIIPYFSRPDIEGVPTGGHSDEELKALSAEWWAVLQKSASEISKGDSVTIGYQGEVITMTGFKIKKITGWGMIQSKAATAVPEQGKADDPG